MRRRTLLHGIGTGSGTALLGTLAGCTDQGGTGTRTATATATATPTEMAPPDVAVATVDPFGQILVGPDGLTLYLFTQDSGGESVCYDQCAENWPPLTVTDEPTAGEDVTAALGTTEREDGSMQVTAAGNPLYYFAGDSEPGETNGQGLGDVWYVLDPAGQAIQSGSDETATATATATSTPTETTMSGSGGGGGGGY